MRPLAWMHGDVQLFEDYAELGLGEGFAGEHLIKDLLIRFFGVYEKNTRCIGV
jgi:hypothetical protein